MPQMSPLLWFNLMIMFLISFGIFFSVVYYLIIPSKMEKSSIPLSYNQKTWKW